MQGNGTRLQFSLRLWWRGLRWSLRVEWPIHSVWNGRRVRDLASLSVRHEYSGVIEQQTGCLIQFEFGSFVGDFGGEQRGLSLGQGHSVLEHEDGG